MTPSYWPSILAFVVVIGLIPLALAVVKRAQNLRPQRQGALRLVSGLSVGPRERIAIVEAGDQRLVLGITAQSIQLLTRLDGPDATEDSPPATAGSPFARMLAQKKRDVDHDPS